MNPSISSMTQPRRTRKRKRIDYFDGDSDFELEPFTSTPRPVRRTTRITTYAESSSSPSSSDNEQSGHETGNIAGSSQPLIPSKKTTQRTRGHLRHMKAIKQDTFANFKRQKNAQRHDQSAEGNKPGSQLIKDSGKTPPWLTLEYQIWLQIIKYAALSTSETSLKNKNRWLVALSTISRSFHELAVSVLYHTPPLVSIRSTQRLLHLLRRPQDSLSTNFRIKIRRLEIDIKNIVARKKGIAVEAIIQNAPLLAEIRLYHPHDDLHAVWAKASAAKVTWTYPEAFFNALDEHHIFLKSFEWNGRFLHQPESFMKAIHQRSCLRSLRSVSLRNVGESVKVDHHKKACAREDLIEAFHTLDELVSLEFHNCSIANDSLISQLELPLLQRLKFSSCQNLSSRGIGDFLARNGRTILNLSLVGNQALDLAWMVDMRSNAPALEVLSIDLTYHDVSSYNDNQPKFGMLFPTGMPTWPDSLREIHAINLRNVTPCQIEQFLYSLTESSSRLHHLSRLNIKIILKEASWRERATTRQKFLKLLEDSFRNTSEKSHASAEVSSPDYHRSSSRLNSHQAPGSSKVQNVGSAKDESLSSNAQDAVTLQNKTRYRATHLTFVIDGQRPSDLQYTTGDFLDESSTDEEWSGDRDFATSGYAW